MLVFHTILPIKPSVTRRQAIDLFIEWVVRNYHLPFVPDDFLSYDRDGHEEFTITKGKYTYAISHYKDETTELTACKLREEDREIWETNNVFVNSHGEVRLYIQTNYIGGSFGNTIPLPHTPFTVKLFIRAGYCCDDSFFNISGHPIVMDESLLEACGLAMQGQWTNILPIVYCSKDYWATELPISDLAKRLQGIAHVIIEPSLEISFKLRETSNANNAFRGHIGIYLPGQSYHRKFSYDYSVAVGEKIVDEIVSTVINAWLNTENAQKYSWDHIQILKSRQKVGKLEHKTDELSDMKELNSMYEDENNRLTSSNTELLKEKRILFDENQRLKELLDAYRSSGSGSESILIKAGTEYDLFPGEQTDLILSILEKEMASLSEDTRPYTLLKSILTANARNGYQERIIAGIEHAFSSSGGICSEKQVRELKSVGFEVEKAGKHYKITFAGDDRYMFTVSATPSDYRTAENMISTITKTLFRKK